MIMMPSDLVKTMHHSTQGKAEKVANAVAVASRLLVVISKVKMDGGGDAAEAKEGVHRQKRSGNVNVSKISISKSKFRRCNKLHLRPRIIIPEARVIQAYNERAYISEDEDGREHPPMPKAIMTVSAMEWLRQKIQQKQKKLKNNDSNGKPHHHHHSRCHCFDCW